MQDVFPIPVVDADFGPITTVPNPESIGQLVQIIDPEFSSVCPKTGLPDYGRVILQYVPKQRLAELKDWKLYLRCYYGVGIMHEPATLKIAQDFINAVDPRKVRLTIDWGARGGLKTVTAVNWDDEKFYHEVDENWKHEAFKRAANDWTNE